jgi:predicted lipid-binding transport protein (Tim44 family)
MGGRLAAAGNRGVGGYHGGLGRATRPGFASAPDETAGTSYILERAAAWRVQPTGSAPWMRRLLQRIVVPMIELVIFAALAAVVLFQLYAVLGRRVGRQPEDAEAEALARPAPKPAVEPVEPRVGETQALSGGDAIRARDPSFDEAEFLSGAAQAYQMLVKAYAGADRVTLKDLTSPSVYQTFDKAIQKREAEGIVESIDFSQPPRADLESAEMVGDKARVKVRFLAEYRSRSKGPEGEAVDDRRTAEVWTFERKVDSRDPNWALARVDAAQA